MNISALSIKHPVPAILLFILLTVFGVIGFQRLDIQQFPDMDQPTVTISASLEGAAPEQLETEVARKIEDKLTSLRKLDHITTTITEGSVSISVSFTIDKDSNEAVQEVRNAVDGAKSELPAALQTPTVSKVTASSGSMLTYTITSDRMGEEELSWFVDNDVAKAVQSVKGVSTVSRIGGVSREVQVDLDPALMSGLGVSASDVSAKLREMQSDSSGGQGQIGGQRQSLRTLGAVHNPSDLAAIAIPAANGQMVRLDQIAKIRDTHSDRSSRAFRDGKETIAFTVSRSLGFGDAAVAKKVRAQVEAFAAQHPQVRIEEASNTITPIIENYKGSMHLVVEGAILAVIVVWLFLRDWRATLVSATALPLSIIPTFGVIYLCGFTLNMVTLLSIALVIGILVDDAIVEVENIERHLRMGKKPYQAAMEAADEIGLAVVATTLTLVAVFLPTAFMGGIPGKIFRQFGITASVAVLMSLLVARLLTPMMAAYMLRASDREERDGAIMHRYMSCIGTTLRKRKATVALAGLFFVVSLAMIPLLPSAFFPAQDNAQTSVSLTLPPGSTLAQTTGLTNQAVRLIKTVPEVTHVFASVGTATSGGMDASASADLASSTLTVDLVERGKRRLKQSGVEEEIRKALEPLPGARVSVGGSGNGQALQIVLAGDDGDLLNQTATKLEQEIRGGISGIGNVTSSAALQRPEIQLTPDYSRAAALGVTSSDIGEAMRLATYGDYSASLPKLNLSDRQVDVRVRMDPAVRTDLDAIGQLRVAGTSGQVALASLGDLNLGSGASQIDRIDRARQVTLTTELNGRPLGEVMREAKQLPTLQSLPTGVRTVEQGELQQTSEMMSSFGLAMAVGIFCIYAVLVLLFHDFLQPATILSALPLSLGGALFALLICNMSFSMPAVIGLLMLMGIVTKNSILLVEYAIMARRQRGLSRVEALLDACHKRARPILMTTIAMGAGMLPTAAGFGADPSFRQPMAVVVIGGLLTSTVLSLLVVPVIFTFVDDLEQRVRAVAGRKLHPGSRPTSTEAT
ncbi:AcrB/AcrD/AcrF family protein [Caulobacter segnis]|uniref:Acriflavin resistance protein n=2 Tax=Caulobacter segnis TaxID=88688 RepID=D5VGB8_CAUST|nr:efflux RND transporter permease subunit [Caulobacter segnis]ADG10237.1 acriflavin resistance protein [Caulobacter segnis ATCC 21756]AVQ01976.1 AcrB/AcrD/AcrF family protein [Caulobacter segnis]